MPWKVRNGDRYYYKTVREGGRVRSEYVGSGQLANLIAGADRVRRIERTTLATIARVDRCLLEGAEKIWADLSGLADPMIRLTLESAGFRKHKRGEWRRSRAGGPASAPSPEVAAASPPPSPPARGEVLDAFEGAAEGDAVAMGRLGEMFRGDPTGVTDLCREELRARAWAAFEERMGVRPTGNDGEMGDEGEDDLMASAEIAQVGIIDPELKALAEKARGGDKGAMSRVGRALEGEPERLVHLGGGDLARVGERLRLHRFAGNDPLRIAAVRAKQDLLRAELQGMDPTPIERLLAEAAVVCWLDCYVSGMEAEVEGGKGADLKLRAFYDRRLERAHKRYISSLKALAQVRKLALPPIQVNIGAQQVNVAGT